MVGTHIQPLSGTYNGEIHVQTGKATGMGILRFPNGEFYAGMFYDDFFCGNGKFTVKLLSVRIGVYQVSSDMFIMGTWLNSTKHGKMTYYNM